MSKEASQLKEANDKLTAAAEQCQESEKKAEKRVKKLEKQVGKLNTIGEQLAQNEQKRKEADRTGKLKEQIGAQKKEITDMKAENMRSSQAAAKESKKPEMQISTFAKDIIQLRITNKRLDDSNEKLKDELVKRKRI